MTLERLTQDEFGNLFINDRVKIVIPPRDISHRGKIRTVILENPSFDVETGIREWAEQYPSSIPKSANAYVISEFNGGTQKIFKDDKGKEHMLSVYAVQFYHYDLFV
ncbi:hypothetical protein HY212_04030 [Candidatus Pacearchaeota archaeon]|nr:hypothetical protein [Candidatus Pacearchaeota archaeon]